MVITQNIYYPSKLTWKRAMERAFDSTKHCEKRLPLKYHGFWERGNFSLKYLKLKKTSSLKPFSGIWKHTNLCNSDDQLSPNVHRFVILWYNWIHQVRILVFHNYRQCPLPLTMLQMSQINELYSLLDPALQQWRLTKTQQDIKMDDNIYKKKTAEKSIDCQMRFCLSTMCKSPLSSVGS